MKTADSKFNLADFFIKNIKIKSSEFKSDLKELIAENIFGFCCFVLLLILTIFVASLSGDFTSSLTNSAKQSLANDLTKNLSTLSALESSANVSATAVNDLSSVRYDISKLNFVNELIIASNYILNVSPQIAEYIFKSLLPLVLMFIFLIGWCCIAKKNGILLMNSVRRIIEVLFVTGIILSLVIPFSFCAVGVLSNELATINSDAYHFAIQDSLSGDNSIKASISGDVVFLSGNTGELKKLSGDLDQLFIISLMNVLVLPLAFIILGRRVLSAAMP